MTGHARFNEAQGMAALGICESLLIALTELNVIIRVQDPLFRHNTGTFHVVAGPDGASVTRVRGRADLAMSIRDLSAIYLGGTPLTALARAGLVLERTKGAAAATAVAFGWPQPPFCPDFF